MKVYVRTVENHVAKSIASIAGSHMRTEVSLGDYLGFHSLYILLHICIILISADQFLLYSKNKNAHYLADKNGVLIFFSIFV